MNLAKPIRKPEMIVKDIGGEVLIFCAEEKVIHVLNPTAQLIWELCDGEHTAGDMTQALQSEFSIPEGHDVGQDVHHTLVEFTAKGLLQSG